MIKLEMTMKRTHQSAFITVPTIVGRLVNINIELRRCVGILLNEHQMVFFITIMNEKANDKKCR